MLTLIRIQLLLPVFDVYKTEEGVGMELLLFISLSSSIRTV